MVETAIQEAVDWEEEWAACAASPVYLCHVYGIIDDSQGESGGGKMPFELWDYQVTMMDLLCSESLLILLKARQLGMSWVCCAWALWKCLFSLNQFGLVLSKGRDEANEMLARIKRLYDRLPQELKNRCPVLIKSNKGELEWSNGSRILSLAATEDAGSGFTASFVILDEFAKMRFPDATYTAVKPTIDGGGQLIIISTAKGVGNIYHELWLKAVQKKNKFFAYFLPWHVRPGRDQAWYDEKLSEQSDPDNHFQEYPESWQQAFLSSGRPRFPTRWLEGHQENICAPLLWSRAHHLIPGCPSDLQTAADFRVYKLPEYGRKYVITADSSKGLPTSDFSPAMVWDADTWEEVALLYGRTDPTIFAGLLISLGQFYHRAWVVVARGNPGDTVLTEMMGQGYQHIAFGPDRQAGWPETKKWKPRTVDNLACALRDNDIIIHTQEALDECAMYQVNDNGTTSAPAGYHDDLVTTCAQFCAFMGQNAPVMAGFAPGAVEIARPATRTWNANGGAAGYDNSGAALSPLPSNARRYSLFGK